MNTVQRFVRCVFFVLEYMAKERVVYIGRRKVTERRRDDSSIPHSKKTKNFMTEDEKEIKRHEETRKK